MGSHRPKTCLTGVVCRPPPLQRVKLHTACECLPCALNPNRSNLRFPLLWFPPTPSSRLPYRTPPSRDHCDYFIYTTTTARVCSLLSSREFGFVLEGRAVVVDDIRVRAVGRSPPAQRPTVETAPVGQEPSPVPVDRASCYWEGLGRVDTAVHKLAELKAGHRVEGETSGEGNGGGGRRGPGRERGVVVRR